MSLESGMPLSSSKNFHFLSFYSIFLSTSSKVSHILFIAHSKTLLWIKALCPISDCVEKDSFLCISMVCRISFCTQKRF